MRRLLIILAIFSTACQKDPDYPDTPRIVYDSISKEVIIEPFTFAKTDVFTISVRFEDGDGDLGEYNINDTSRPDNYVVDTYKKVSGTFILQSLAVPLGGKFGNLTPENYVGPLDGTLNYEISIQHANLGAPGYPLDAGDTLRFDVHILDRAGNISNTVSSGEAITGI